MHVGLPEPNGTGSIWMISKLVTIAGRILCSSVSAHLDQQHAEQGRRERRGQPSPYQPRADGPRRIASGDGGDLWFRGPSLSNCPRRTSGPEETPGTIVEARSNYCRLLQQVHIPGDAMEGTTADQSVWLGEDRSPPAERHFEAAAAGMSTVRRHGCSGSGRTHSHCSRDVPADGAH